MALVSAIGFLRVLSVIAAAPEPSQCAGFGVGKYGRAIDDARRCGVINGNFDHIDAKQGGAIIPWRLVKASGQFLFIANARDT